MRGLRTTVLTFGCVVACAASSFAQRPASEFLSVQTVTTKPSGALDYEEFVKKVIAAAAKVNASPSVVYTFQATSGPGYTYVIGIPFNKWAETDKWMGVAQLLTKAYGDVEGARILKTGRGNIETSETTVYRLSDTSSATSVVYPLQRYAMMVRTAVKPDMTREYGEYLSKLKEAEVKLGVPGRVRRASVQGTSNLYVSTILFQNQADRDSWPGPGDSLIKAFGEAEGRRLLELGNRAVQSREIIALTTRPDLSRMPPAGS